MVFAQNVLRPKSGVTRRIWEIADDITKSHNRKAERGEVLARARREGIHEGTTSKQYNDWRKDYENQRQPSGGFEEAPAVAFDLSLQIGADGRVLIPVELRRQMKIDNSGRLTARIVDGELRLISPSVALEQLQRLFAPLRDGPSLVDELLLERRAEAARE